MTAVANGLALGVGATLAASISARHVPAVASAIALADSEPNDLRALFCGAASLSKGGCFSGAEGSRESSAESGPVLLLRDCFSFGDDEPSVVVGWLACDSPTDLRLRLDDFSACSFLPISELLSCMF